MVHDHVIIYLSIIANLRKYDYSSNGINAISVSAI